MEIVEFIFNFLTYLAFGFVALVLLLIIVTALFGKKVEKQYDLEAEFHDDNGKVSAVRTENASGQT